MSWHLKDRKFEKTLEEFTGGNFVKSLNYAIEQENIDSDFIVYVEFGRNFLGEDNAENCLCFRTDELEEIPEYNPNGWNDSRKVKPPEDIFLRVKIHYAISEDPKKYFTNYGCLIYNQGSWYSIDDDKPYEYPIEIRAVDWIEFRPWDD